MDADCQDFADELANAVLRSDSWDLDALAGYSVPALQSVIIGASMQRRMFAAFGAVFGRLSRMDPGDVQVTIANRRGQRSIVCAFRAEALFANGPGIFSLQARLENDTWRLLTLNVNTIASQALPEG